MPNLYVLDTPGGVIQVARCLIGPQIEERESAELLSRAPHAEAPREGMIVLAARGLGGTGAGTLCRRLGQGAVSAPRPQRRTARLRHARPHAAVDRIGQRHPLGPVGPVWLERRGGRTLAGVRIHVAQGLQALTLCSLAQLADRRGRHAVLTAYDQCTHVTGPPKKLLIPRF